jgi:hypothetical protein
MGAVIDWANAWRRASRGAPEASAPRPMSRPGPVAHDRGADAQAAEARESIRVVLDVMEPRLEQHTRMLASMQLQWVRSRHDLPAAGRFRHVLSVIDTDAEDFARRARRAQAPSAREKRARKLLRASCTEVGRSVDVLRLAIRIKDPAQRAAAVERASTLMRRAATHYAQARRAVR